MKLGNKILIVALGAVAATAVTALLIQRSVIRRQGIEMIRADMRDSIVQAQNVRQSVATLNQSGAINMKKLLVEMRQNGDLASSAADAR